jgi:hypothetical protein
MLTYSRAMPRSLTADRRAIRVSTGYRVGWNLPLKYCAVPLRPWRKPVLRRGTPNGVLATMVLAFD